MTGAGAGAAARPAAALPWLLSAHDEPSLRAQARRLRSHLEAHGDIAAADVARSLASGRAQHAHRAVVVGRDRDELLAGLGAVAAAAPADGVARGIAAPPGMLAFVFPGQGSQWPGMALALMAESPAFAASMRDCEQALAPFVDWKLDDVLGAAPGAELWEHSDVVQPALFCVMVSLAALWRSFGVTPDAVVGHSLGEISAACVAGILSLEDAARVAALTSRALAQLGGDDGMVLVGLGADALRARVAQIDGRLTLAAFNGPRAIVVAGAQAALDALLDGCERDGVRARRIRVDGTSSVAHSEQIEAIRERLARDLAPVAPRASDVTFYSAVTGEPLDHAQLGPEYWYRSLRQPVRFEQATRALVRDGATAFVESSPHPVLTFAVEGTIEVAPQDAAAADRVIPVLGSLRRDGGLARMLVSLGEAHAHGVAVDWEPALAGPRSAPVQLPTFAFERHDHVEDPGVAAPAPDPAREAAALDEAALLELVRTHAAAVLGHEGTQEIGPRRAFRELGMESLQGVELRNRLAQVTGLRLASTLVYDHPTPAAVAQRLRAMLSGADRAARATTVRARAHLDEPIAIVGMSCRYPGGVRSAEELWELVAAGTDAIGPFPTDRGWDLDALYDPDPDAPGRSYVRDGGFLYDAPDFDAAFFQIAPREASVMDPQQRIMLETAWAALEDAAIDPQRLEGTPTGVFVGVSSQDYASFLPGVATDYEGLRMTGCLTSVVSGRISYALGLQGPAVTIDTACSSSLVALHLACQALRAGECSLALAGGVTVLASPGMFVEFSRQRGLAKDGRSKAFAAAADGASWAEGAGVLVVERLSDARRNGHRVLGLVRGTATNQDGASNGLSAPNGPSQEQVIRQALANAGLAPGDVDAVEAHGTGTTLGDPIEAGALLATYGQDRRGAPLRLGSIKSNIGHSHAAAGVAGVIKMVMAMRAGVLAPTLHVDEPTPHVDWSAGEIALLTEPAAWPRGGQPRRAGVSGFGISGTNAHVVLEEAPADADVGADEPAAGGDGPVPWILSAKTASGVRAQAARLRAHLDADEGLAPVDVGWSLAAGRARLAHRAAVVGRDRATLLAGLDAVAAGMPADGVATGAAREAAKVAFVFPGQGSQWLGMALELWDGSAVFAERMEACADALRPHVDWDLREVLLGTPGAPALERMDVVQPASFAVFVSLAALWRSYGVTPSVVVGHSQGEIAAAHVAGALTLDDAARVAALRSRALVALAGAGAMMSVFLPADDVLARLERWDGRISLASYNGPRSTVVSGEPQALRELLEECEAAGERARMIAVDYASHSAQIEAIRERLLEELAPIRPVSAAIAIVSTTTAAPIDGALLDAGHWYRNLREPVRFEQATRALLRDGVTAFVESSPHPVLTWALQETVDAAADDPEAIAVVGSLRRGEGTLERFLASAGEAYAGGVHVDWERVFAGRHVRRVGLPTYPFERTRFWLQQRVADGGAAALSAAGIGAAEHPLLGATIDLAGGDGLLLSGRLALGSHPWLADHELRGEPQLAPAAFVELALQAGARAGCGVVDELVLAQPLALPAQGAVQLQVTVSAAREDGGRALEIHARPDGEAGPWQRHATGALRAGAPTAHAPPAAWPPAGAEPLDADELLDRLADRGAALGPAFQCVRAAWRLADELYVEAALAAEQAAEAGRFAVHPALLEALLQPALALRAADGLAVAARWAAVDVRRPGAAALRARIVPGDGGALRLTATDEHGEPVLSIGAVVVRSLAPAAGGRPRDAALEALYRVRWTPVAITAAGAGRPRVAVLGDAGAGCLGDLAALGAAGVAPGTIAVARPPDVPAALALLQRFVADERLADARLAILVPGASAVLPGEAPVPRAAAIRGLVRSAQSEHPGRIISIDAQDAGAVAPAIAAGEPEVAVRDGAVLVPRLAGAPGDPPPSGTWRLAPERAGALVAAAPEHGDGDRPLAAGEVRLRVRAAGVNRRDVLVAIGVHTGPAQLGVEAAGVVAEVGPQVTGLAVGDRVMGFVAAAFGPLAVADRRALVAMPAGWSFAQAAAAPVAQCAAQLALVDVAGVQPGERVLVHAAAGAVGMAAVVLALALGAEVFATASPEKWGALRALGLDDEHLASSRSPEFADRFGGSTGDAGVDVVLSSLSDELVDASLRLLGPGGRFVDLRTADVREPAAVAAAHPGVRYAAVDLLAEDPVRLGALLGAVAGRVRRGALAPPRLTAYDVRDGSEALALVGRGGHAGKVVLTVPHALDPAGTVLVTGGTGGLGAVVAEHLAREHGARHLLLVSRRGPAADGAGELRDRLARLGCEAQVAACDVADRDALAGLLDAIDERRPLTAVVHAAGTLDNAMIESIDAVRLHGVLRPKADAARWLDELTAGLDLAAFLMFSSVAATFSHPGQGNYAAANAYLDALAQRRRSQGLPATAVAWGLWGTGSGMSTRLSRQDVEVLAADTGQRVLPAERALALFDAALGHRAAHLVATTLDLAPLRAQARSGMLPPLLSELVRVAPRRGATRAGGAGSLPQTLAAAAPADRPGLVLELVRAQVAAVLGHASGDDVAPDRTFKELGFDSLGAVVLRNRLSQITGLALPSTLGFDHPTPVAMAAFIAGEARRAAPGADEPPAADEHSVAPPTRPPVVAALAAAGARAPAGPDGASSANGAHGLPARQPAADVAAPAPRRYRGRVLTSIAGVVRGLRLRAWVLRTRLRLARLGCTFAVELDGTPRLEDLPRVVVEAIGERRGSLTLRIGRDCRFGRDLTLDIWTHADGVVEIGDGCHFQDHVRLQPWGGAIRFAAGVHVRDGAELKSKGELVVGADSAIGRNATLHCHERIELADHVAVAEGVNVMDSDHTHDGSDTHFILQRVLSSPVLVESNVLIGTNALVLRGSHVGRNAMIAAGSVLTGGEYPERYLLAGVPAQPLRPLAPDEHPSA